MPRLSAMTTDTPTRVFVFGINPPQVELVRKAFPATVQIVGSEVFNANIRSKIQNYDLVIVSKFSSHKAYQMFKNVCGNKRVSFASGGMSMIKKQIQRFIATSSSA